ncbi:MAG: hypothetical protein EBR69_02105 [Synechococcaceae bacterium WB4_2_0805]|nr:hypothetical protein [Synechococcaceae bacterium WB4_2_0805]
MLPMGSGGAQLQLKQSLFGTMASPLARTQQKLRKQWASDAQIVECRLIQNLGEIRGLAVKRGALSRYKFNLASDTLTLTPVLKAFSWERGSTSTRNFTVA